MLRTFWQNKRNDDVRIVLLNLKNKQKTFINVYCNRQVRNNNTTTWYSMRELVQQWNVWKTFRKCLRRLV